MFGLFVEQVCAVDRNGSLCVGDDVQVSGNHGSASHVGCGYLR